MNRCARAGESATSNTGHAVMTPSGSGLADDASGHPPGKCCEKTTELASSKAVTVVLSARPADEVFQAMLIASPLPCTGSRKGARDTERGMSELADAECHSPLQRIAASCDTRKGAPSRNISRFASSENDTPILPAEMEYFRGSALTILKQQSTTKTQFSRAIIVFVLIQ